MGRVRTQHSIPLADPDAPEDAWFREPNRREHLIGAGVFLGFGLFFLLLFPVLAGWGFRWVIAGLGLWSILRGLGHIRCAARKGRKDADA